LRNQNSIKGEFSAAQYWPHSPTANFLDCPSAYYSSSRFSTELPYAIYCAFACLSILRRFATSRSGISTPCVSTSWLAVGSQAISYAAKQELFVSSAPRESSPSAQNQNPFEGDSPEAKKRRQAAKRVILFTVFLDLLGFGIIIPQLGVYAAQFGADPRTVGLLASTYSAMGFLFAPFWGYLSDRIGRRPVLLYSIFGTAVGYVIFAFSGSLPLLFLSRTVDGITSGNISTAQAYLSDITPPEERAKTFGLFGAVFGVGFAIGPTVGALISYLPGVWGTNFGLGIFTAALAFLNWALAVKRLPETLSTEIRRENLASDARHNRKWQIFNVRSFRARSICPVWVCSSRFHLS
jgi:nitrate/nitrite transporter NarK